MFPFVSFKPFWGLPPFHFLFLSFSLSLSLSCSFLSSFLSVSHFCIWFLLFLFVLFVFFFQVVLLFLFSACCLSCFALNHNLRFVFALHLVFSLLLFFVFVAFVFCYLLIFGSLSKTSLKNMEIPKTAKIKNAEEKRTSWQEQLAQVCSQIVSFFLFVFLSILHFCWNHYKNGGFSQKQKKQSKILKKKNWSKLKLKIGPSMLHNIIGPLFNFRKCFCCFLLVFQKSSSFCRENEIFQNKRPQPPPPPKKRTRFSH